MVSRLMLTRTKDCIKIQIVPKEMSTWQLLIMLLCYDEKWPVIKTSLIVLNLKTQMYSEVVMPFGNMR